MNFYQKKVGLFAFCVLLFSCTATKEVSVKSSYDNQFDTYINHLNKGRAVEKNTQTLTTLLERIINVKTVEKDSLKLKNSLESKEQIVAINDYLTNKINTANTHLKGRFDTNLATIEGETTTLREQLVNDFFQLGRNDLSQATKNGNKTQSHKAHLHLQKAKKYGKADEGIDDLIQQSKTLAQVVYNVKVVAPFNQATQYLIEEQFNGLKSKQGDFKKIYLNEVTTQKADCIVQINLEPFQSNTQESNNRKNFEKKVQVGSTVRYNSEGVGTTIPDYEVVKGSVNIREIKQTARWEAVIAVKQNTNYCKLDNKRVREEFLNHASIYTIAGDERAVPQQYQQNTNDNILREREMMEEVLARLFRQIEPYF